MLPATSFKARIISNFRMKTSLLLLVCVGSALAEIYFEDRFDKGTKLLFFEVFVEIIDYFPL